MSKVTCGECGADMVLRQSPKYPAPFWGCTQFPECRGTHGAHPDGRPLGIPANRETKDKRIEAHKHFDPIWEQKLMTRKEAYRRLAKEMGVAEVHIGESDIETCEKIIQISRQIWHEETEPDCTPGVLIYE
jgi:ssDNA-binding Zn-finger/Zn-ribbon topoisomerase 1